MQAEAERERAVKELEDQLQVRETNEATIQQLRELVRRMEAEAQEKVRLPASSS